MQIKLLATRQIKQEQRIMALSYEYKRYPLQIKPISKYFSHYSQLTKSHSRIEYLMTNTLQCLLLQRFLTIARRTISLYLKDNLCTVNKA